MRRLTLTPRSDWQARVERVGLTYHTLPDGSVYWDESAYWEFSSREIDRLEAATAEIQKLALAAGDAILDQGRLTQMGIPDSAAAAIRAAWNSEPPALYGRLDLAYDGDSIKLLEYNADTPTGLVEAAVAQWYWLQDCFPDRDQFNSLHEKLVAKWKDLKNYVASPIHFADAGSDEDSMTTTYLRDTAQQGGLKTRQLRMHEIGWDSKHSRFVDLENRPIQTLFKLYPWEWLLREPFAATRKPLFGREGSGIAVVRDGAVVEGVLANDHSSACVYQALAPMAQAAGKTAVFGSWLNTSSFVPHLFR